MFLIVDLLAVGLITSLTMIAVAYVDTRWQFGIAGMDSGNGHFNCGFTTFCGAGLVAFFTGLGGASMWASAAATVLLPGAVLALTLGTMIARRVAQDAARRSREEEMNQ